MAIDKFKQDHDPLDISDYTFRFRLSAGETIVSATVIVVDPTTWVAPIVPSDLLLANVSFGLMPDGTTYGVTVWATGGTATKSYYLQCQIATNSTPTPRVFVRTANLLVTKK